MNDLVAMSLACGSGCFVHTIEAGGFDCLVKSDSKLFISKKAKHTCLHL